MRKIILPVIAMMLGGCLSPVLAQRAIPDNNLAYPVLITIGSSSGSGFYINTGRSVFLVTAKHVIFEAPNKMYGQSMELLSYSKDPSDRSPNIFTVDLGLAVASGDFRQSANEDVVVIKISTMGVAVEGGGHMTTFEKGVASTKMSKAGVVGAPLELIRPLKDVLTGNDVILFGYPSSLNLQQSSQLDWHYPLLRKGIVAGVNPERHSIIIDCPSYFGNSGGPVIELDRDGFTTKLSIIGIVLQYVPFIQTGGSQTFVMQLASNSGYSIVLPMDPILELIGKD